MAMKGYTIFSQAEASPSDSYICNIQYTDWGRGLTSLQRCSPYIQQHQPTGLVTIMHLYSLYKWVFIYSVIVNYMNDFIFLSFSICSNPCSSQIMAGGGGGKEMKNNLICRFTWINVLISIVMDNISAILPIRLLLDVCHNWYILIYAIIHIFWQFQTKLLIQSTRFSLCKKIYSLSL